MAATLGMGLAFFGLASHGVAQEIEGARFELADFDWNTDTLSGFGDGRSEVDVFALVASTSFDVGPPPDEFPPTPCRGLAASWNEWSEDEQSPESARQKHFRVLLDSFASNSCAFEIVSDGAGNVVSLNPVP